MNRIERTGDPEEALAMAMKGHQAEIWTSLPAIIQSFDPVKQTCTAQPAIQGRIRQKDGSQKWVNMPLLVDVPVQFPGGGGYTLTFPVAKGDEALIVFSSRCIDAWWQSGGVQQQAEMRMHDLSDGYALVGIRSVPRKLAGGTNMDGTQLRADGGGAYIELTGNTVNIIAPGGVYMNGKRIDTHTHSNVQPGGGTSGDISG